LLYDTDAEDIFEVVNSVKEKYNSLMLFGHNPALTQFSNYVSDKKIDNIPTTGFVEIEMNVTTWKEVVVDCGTVKRFLSPKILMNK
jgi:phosphohistidine phosphatase